ncbi:MAG: CRISPR-associated protein Cmr3 [Gammaproteobacteria bacterium]|nr:MAG: CRISPR-associated protein Cmr3 [Gammaproteobacteria bacterium]
MTSWLIQPRDPLIFRDGRPFTADPGARATTLPFPFPSTLAGAVRTLSGTDPSSGKFDESMVETLLQHTIRGPLLISLNAEDGVAEFYPPAPADALLLKDKNDKAAALRLWLRPVKPPQGTQTDLKEPQHILAPRRPRNEKVFPQAPGFWRWKEFEAWLLHPLDEHHIANVKTWGLPALPQEYRTHVRITPDSQTADPGGLFVTSGLEFTYIPASDDEAQSLAKAIEFGLMIDTDAGISSATWGFLGGERRIAGWQSVNTQFPLCPDEIRKRIVAEKHCRLILLTPAIFKDGYRPTWLLHQAGVQAEVLAAAVHRYQAVSGWDYQAHKPKATRRLAPAGSVYYLRLDGSSEAIGDFVDAVWMQNVSDELQDRRDGFGLAVLGTWDGEVVDMEVPNA